MASSYSPWIYRKILYKIPFLFKRCYAQNYHWFWDRFCFCCENEHFAIGKDYPGQSGEWHGGIRDFKTGIEYIRYHPQEDLKLNASMLAKQCDRAMSLEIDNMELRRELWRSHFPHTTRCDACGEIIRDDEKNVGYECDLHERCAHE